MDRNDNISQHTEIYTDKQDSLDENKQIICGASLNTLNIVITTIVDQKNKRKIPDMIKTVLNNIEKDNDITEGVSDNDIARKQVDRYRQIQKLVHTAVIYAEADISTDQTNQIDKNLNLLNSTVSKRFELLGEQLMYKDQTEGRPVTDKKRIIDWWIACNQDMRFVEELWTNVDSAHSFATRNKHLEYEERKRMHVSNVSDTEKPKEMSILGMLNPEDSSTKPEKGSILDTSDAAGPSTRPERSTILGLLGMNPLSRKRSLVEDDSETENKPKNPRLENISDIEPDNKGKGKERETIEDDNKGKGKEKETIENDNKGKGKEKESKDDIDYGSSSGEPIDIIDFD